MKETVTVEQALNKGRMQLVILPMLIIVGGIGIGVFIKRYYFNDTWVIAIATVASFIISWLAWSYLVVSWKVWAFGNVRNVNELERKAIEQKMIWPDGSWFNKTEIWSYEQKQQWHHIEKKFLEKDVYKDDLAVPKETRLYYSKVEVYLGMIIGCVLIFIFFYLFGYRKNYIWTVAPLFGVYFLYKGIKKFLARNQPQLIIDSEGVYVEKRNEKFLWQRINSWTIRIDRSGSYFDFFYKDEEPMPDEAFHPEELDEEDYFRLDKIEIEINEFNLSVAKIEKLLQVYEARNQKDKPGKA